MIRKVLRIIGWVCVGIAGIYLFLTLIAVPLAAPWLIGSQATKALRHPVAVRSVVCNPFLWRITVGGFGITDAKKQLLAGFDKLSVDVSFLSLFKKEYRIESVRLEGLKVNVELLSGNRINLLDLVPAGTPVPAETSVPAGTAVPEKTGVPAPAGPAAPLPVVFLDSFVMQRGTVNFVDTTLTPNFVTSLSDIDVQVTGVSTKPDRQAKVRMSALIDKKGRIGMEAVMIPLSQPLQAEVTFTLSGYALQVLTPYVGKYTGRAVKEGSLDVKMDYRISENTLTASHKVLVQRFEFGQKVESKDALNLPFGLALALLEDSEDRISIALPVTGDMSSPEFHYFHLIGQVARNFFFKLITKPFSFLGSMLGAEAGTEEMGYVRFSPGASSLSEEEKTKLSLIVKGLQTRPKLLLKVNGAYDPAVDWKAIKTEVYHRDYRVLSEESDRTDDWVSQTLYQRSFGIRALWALTRSYQSKDGSYDNAKINEEIKRRLIDEAAPDKTALEALALERAKAVHDFVIAAGFDAKRVSLGETHTVQSTMGFVPLELALTVFDEPDGNK
jgi:hypothetical protein